MITQTELKGRRDIFELRGGGVSVCNNVVVSVPKAKQRVTELFLTPTSPSYSRNLDSVY